MTDPVLTPEILLRAYAMGIFPMAEGRDTTEIHWVDPRRRGVFELERFHISRSLRRALLRPDYTVTVDRDFDGVLQGCADRSETWINGEIAILYKALHAKAHAHSLEVWSPEGAFDRRGLRRGSGGGFLWGKHVLAPHGCVKNRAGVVGASAAGGGIPLV